MSIITSAEVFTYLADYGIDSTIINETVLQEQIDFEIVPQVEKLIGPLGSTAQVTRNLSGGDYSLVLPFKKPVSVDAIEYIGTSGPAVSQVALDTNTGILRSKVGTFPVGHGNVKVTITIGHAVVGDSIKLALKLLAAVFAMEYVADMTGGGDSVTTDGHVRNFGKDGKFTTVRRKFKKRATRILSEYMVSI